jgi:hypothetical protein
LSPHSGIEYRPLVFAKGPDDIAHEGLDYVGVVSEDPLRWLLPRASFLPSTEFDCCLHRLLDK